MSLLFTTQTKMEEIKHTETETLQLGPGYQSSLIAHFGTSSISEV